MESSSDGSLTSKSRRLATPEDGPSAAPPEAHAPPATAATETARATAAAVTVLLREPVTARGLCAGKEPVKNPGLCAVPAYHS